MEILLEDLMAKGIEHASKMGAHFVEAKGEDTILRSIEVINGEVRKTSESRSVGSASEFFIKRGTASPSQTY
jgi:predicted Zn-dependent protease